MRIIIVGCGKLGSGLALELEKKNHKITVIDTVPEAFELLGKSFKGETVVGVGFDRDILEKAHIKTADAIVACSKNDDANALIGRLAQTVYRVPRVISRLYDPRRAKIYRALGIRTISTTTWGVRRVTDMLGYDQLDSVLSLGDGNLEIIRADIPELLVGKTVNDISAVGEIQIVAISRGNNTAIPTLGTALRKDDVVYAAVMSSSMSRFKSILGLY